MLPGSRRNSRYARVLAVVGATARLKRGARLQGATLADVAREIPDYREFCGLCREDLRGAWFDDRDTGERSVHNRVETWERLYGHWQPRCGKAGDPPAIRIRAIGRTGSYEVLAAVERRSAEGHRNAVMRNCAALHIPPENTESFLRANAHFYEEWEKAPAIAAPPGQAQQPVSKRVNSGKPKIGKPKTGKPKSGELKTIAAKPATGIDLSAIPK